MGLKGLTSDKNWQMASSAYRTMPETKKNNEKELKPKTVEQSRVGEGSPVGLAVALGLHRCQLPAGRAFWRRSPPMLRIWRVRRGRCLVRCWAGQRCWRWSRGSSSSRYKSCRCRRRFPASCPRRRRGWLARTSTYSQLHANHTHHTTRV